MTEPQPPGGAIDDGAGPLGSRFQRMLDEMGASLASSGITPGEDIRLEPEMANAILTRATELLDKLRSVQSDSDVLRRVKPAAADMVSTDYNKKLTTFGEFVANVNPFAGAGAFDAGVSQLDGAITYLKSYVDKLNEALGKTQGADQHNEEVLTKAAQPQQEQKPGGMVG
jgi:hypothetical protein